MIPATTYLRFTMVDGREFTVDYGRILTTKTEGDGTLLIFRDGTSVAVQQRQPCVDADREKAARRETREWLFAIEAATPHTRPIG